MKKIIFFCELRKDANQNDAYSSAGDQVQNEILEAITNISGTIITCISHEPNPMWPKGSLFISGSRGELVIRPSYINAPLLKQLTIFFHFLWYALSLKPDLLLKYNANIIDVVALFIARGISKANVCVIIQDVIIKNKIRYVLSSFFNLIAIKLCKYFDVLVPITSNIAEEFNFPKNKTIVFPGGMTRQTREILNATKHPEYDNLTARAVFAGALEPYNGIDWLVKHWIDEKVSIPLFVFGNGTLKNLIEAEQIRSGGKVIYMGFRDESFVSQYISSSKINVCLRFSKGLKEEYFFPSKFINQCAAPGLIMCNEFKNIPALIVSNCCIVEDTVKDCINKIEKLSITEIKYYHEQRLKWLHGHANWSDVARQIVKKLRWEQ